MKRNGAIDCLFPAIRQRLLATTLLHPEKRWYLSELATRISTRPSSLQRELQSLTEAGILNRTMDGNRAYFQADKTSPIYPELHGLMKKSLGAVEVLREALSPLAGSIDLAFIYGSYVNLTQVKNHSDIDLMVIGEATGFQLSQALSSVENDIGREVNPTIYSRKEFSEKRFSGHHFLSSVLRSERLPILGNVDVLAATSE